MIGKHVLVTGGTSGIGKQVAFELAKEGATVIIVGRNEIKTQNVCNELKTSTANKNIDFLIADLSSIKAIHRLEREYSEKYDRLDILINNAGAMFSDYQLSTDGYEMTFALNHLSYFLLTHLLLDTMKKTADTYGDVRIINTSSSAHDSGVRPKDYKLDTLHERSQFKGLKNYSISKLMNILFTYELARKLEGHSITVNAVHPGVTNSGFGHNTSWFSSQMIKVIQRFFAINPEKAAETIVYLAVSKELEGVSGKYWSKKQQIKSSDLSYNRELQKELWDYSINLTKG